MFLLFNLKLNFSEQGPNQQPKITKKIGFVFQIFAMTVYYNNYTKYKIATIFTTATFNSLALQMHRIQTFK